MALHTFFFTAPEELARPPVGLEFEDLPTGLQASLACACVTFSLATWMLFVASLCSVSLRLAASLTPSCFCSCA